jgi:hypothetical protein
MKRSILMRVVVMSISVLLSALFAGGFAQGRKQRPNPAPECPKAALSDWRYPESLTKEDAEAMDVGEGFKADYHACGATVFIPGAYSDTIKVGGHGFDLKDKLAAAVFVKVMAAPTQDVEEALQKYYLGSKDVRQGNGEVETEHLFRLSNGRTARIFVYFNDRYGLTGVVKTGPASGKK